MRLLLAFVAVAAWTLSGPVHAAQGHAAQGHAAQNYVALERRLSAEQMRATGLDALSPEQLALLNQLLSEDQGALVEAAVAERAADDVGRRDQRTAATPVTASVQGEVRAWSRGDAVLLDNGQRWRVIEGNLYLGKPVTNPKVTLSPGFMGAWYMQVEGQSSRLKVQRVD
ncbi:hypothetical protein MNR01_15070 [Lysobacter sp. S4-A87]|uniref:hypothetical protein n=1 Tax=Lysobacter sp. S4-A87 TaxID=2925843 RepID=UPI001F53C670|nr:hypothetical protein [Lysobacter sp. S4-A87]UNK49039.1 hypothetical protein MNR01_15070 [Lysobacter sp. S4-A87]